MKTYEANPDFWTAWFVQRCHGGIIKWHHWEMWCMGGEL